MSTAVPRAELHATEDQALDFLGSMHVILEEAPLRPYWAKVDGQIVKTDRMFRSLDIGGVTLRQWPSGTPVQFDRHSTLFADARYRTQGGIAVTYSVERCINLGTNLRRSVTTPGDSVIDRMMERAWQADTTEGYERCVAIAKSLSKIAEIRSTEVRRKERAYGFDRCSPDDADFILDVLDSLSSR